MKQSTKDFIDQLLHREVQAEEAMDYEERNEYADDLIDAYNDFQKFYYKDHGLGGLLVDSKEELAKKIYGE